MDTVLAARVERLLAQFDVYATWFDCEVAAGVWPAGAIPAVERFEEAQNDLREALVAELTSQPTVAPLTVPLMEGYSSRVLSDRAEDRLREIERRERELLAELGEIADELMEELYPGQSQECRTVNEAVASERRPDWLCAGYAAPHSRYRPTPLTGDAERWMIETCGRYRPDA
jgi:hypothetical protein